MDLTGENVEVKRQSALLKTIDMQIRERMDGVMEGIRIQASAAEAQYKNVDEVMKIREAEKEKEQKKYDPYVATKRNLETKKQRRQALMMKITAEAIDALKDEFSENELKEKREKEYLVKRKVNVMGQVFKQGPVEIPDDKPELTILDAIGMAGGTTRLAKESSVQVMRSGQKPLKFDLEKLRKETDPTKVFILQAGDIIFVPAPTF